MLAKYQNIIFEVEKLKDLPAYHLNHNKRYYGTVYLDSGMISIPVVEGDTLETCLFMRHEMVGKFEIINYDVVTSEWIVNIMEAKGLDVSQMAQIAGTSESTMYRILKTTDEISGPIKSSLFNFFNK